MVCRITNVLCGLEPPPEDDYDGVRFEARSAHMAEFSTEPGTAQGPDSEEGDISDESSGEDSDEDDDSSDEASEEEDISEVA